MVISGLALMKDGSAVGRKSQRKGQSGPRGRSACRNWRCCCCHRVRWAGFLEFGHFSQGDYLRTTNGRRGGIPSSQFANRWQQPISIRLSLWTNQTNNDFILGTS